MRVCVCPSVDTLTVALLRRVSPNWTQTCKPPKVRTNSLWSISNHPFPYFPPKTSIFDPEVLKTHAKMKNEISALNVHESPKFPRLIGNQGRGTRWWRQIFHHKSWTCELGYGADTMFHRTYFLYYFTFIILQIPSSNWPLSNFTLVLVSVDITEWRLADKVRFWLRIFICINQQQ